MASAILSHRKKHGTQRAGNTGFVRLKVLALFLALATALLFVDALSRPLAPFDLWGIKLIQSVDLPHLGKAMRPFNAMASSLGAVVAWTLVFGALLIKRKWLPALAVMALPIGGLVNAFLNNFVVARSRPHGYEGVRSAMYDLEGNSFPSGHVMGAVLLYGMIFFLAKDVKSRKRRVLVRLAAVSMIGVVGFARVWYGAHWPSDVLASYTLGGLMLVCIIAIYIRLEPRADDLPHVWNTLRTSHQGRLRHRRDVVHLPRVWLHEVRHTLRDMDNGRPGRPRSRNQRVSGGTPRPVPPARRLLVRKRSHEACSRGEKSRTLHRQRGQQHKPRTQAHRRVAG